MISMTRRSMSASAIALLGGCATQTQTTTQTASAAPGAAPAIGTFGIDLTARDLSVSAGDDFFRHANGLWLDNTEIPADRTRWGSFDMLIAKSERDVRTIVEEVALAGGAPGSKRQKIADCYNSYLNVDAIEARGLEPAQADLALIAAARTHEDIVRLMARPDIPTGSPLALFVGLDSMNPDRNVTSLTHAGISLPDRDYYLQDNERFTAIRREFVAHIERMLTLGGQRDAGAKARRIVALQTEIARRHWPLTERREVDRVYNPRTRAQVEAFAARFPWGAFFDAAELGGVPELVVLEVTAMGPLAELVMATPVSTWRDYLTYGYLAGNAAVLPRAFDDESFAFFGRTLQGQPQQRERWQRSVTAVNGALGEAVGELYVARHFPPEAKSQMLALVENLRRAYGERIDGLTWMSAETKVQAREKLRTFLPKIGYPDRWRDYSALDVRAGDAFGNQKRAGVYFWRYNLARLNRPTDKTEWLFINPQIVNAYYNPTFNEIVFPAAILQPPFFDPNADPAVNYGGIGGVIGHEMGHGFDDQGAKADARGILRDWWTPSDLTAFTALGDRLVEQYNRFEALPGEFVNGRLTLGENIGDNGGLQVAYYAYQMSLNGQPAPTIDGFSGDQRFFLSWGQIWRTKIRDDAARNRLRTDSHSPGKFRCSGPVRNMDAWYAAFSVQPDDALYLPEDQRIEIW